MKRFLLIPLLIVAATIVTPSQTPGVGTQSKGDPFSGTWKANLSKSQQHANHRFESATLRFEVSDNAVLITFTGVNMGGQKESGTRELHADGKEYPVARAPGVVEISKWVGSNMLETVARKDGTVVGQGTYEVSSDGKTLTAKVKGIDQGGASFEQVIVFDREQPR
jgi:hypothetical protein